jgi:hypothetical protein
MINLDTAKFCIWGFKNKYHTYGHVHEAYLRALRHMGRQAIWVDAKDDVSNVDFSNTFFMSVNDVMASPIEMAKIPLRTDCFYAMHNNLQGNRSSFDGLDWMAYGNYLRKNPRYPGQEIIAPDTVFYPESKTVDFFFATDMLPHEIEKNKPSRVFNSGSRVVNWVASSWQGARNEIEEFRRACEAYGIRVDWWGHERKGVVSIEDHVRLIQESYIAPALVSPEQYTMGYIPCRIMKNISYGQYGVCNSEHINEVFDGRLICNRDSFQLFFDAKERLPEIKLSEIHSLMDYVAENHTYLNRVDALLKSARLVLENK